MQQGIPPALDLVENLLPIVARKVHVPAQDREDLWQELRLIWLRDGESILARERQPYRRRAYVYTVLRRRALNWCRDHSWREASYECALPASRSELPATDDALTRLVRDERDAERVALVTHALGGLKPDARRILELRYIVGMPVTGIARQLELTPPVESMRLWRAIRLMKRAIDGAEGRKEAQKLQRDSCVSDAVDTFPA